MLECQAAHGASRDGLDPEVVRPLLEEARLAGATLDATALGLLLAANIERLAEELLGRPDDVSLMERLNNAQNWSGYCPSRSISGNPKHLLQDSSHMLLRLQGKGRLGRRECSRMDTPFHGFG